MKALLIVVTFAVCSCRNGMRPLSQAPLIPKPVSVIDAPGSFILTNAASVFTEGTSKPLRQLAETLAARLRPATGFDLQVSANKSHAAALGGILLRLNDKDTASEEGYQLKIGDSGIVLTAGRPAGIFRGIQTLLQVFPNDIENASRQSRTWRLPAGVIDDYPAYSFRSAMLDASRHFFSVADVKRFIDEIAFYKINTLHLHLADDQGWRIEIRSWPRLTSYGAATQVGGGKGGFYTQDQYRDIVRYAAARFITIIPEIDMPGHTNAALASYAELNCNDSAPPLYTKTEVGFSSLCVKKPLTYQFVDDVVRELSSLTPGPWIHLGGDESHATSSADYIEFVNRVQGIPEKYGKRMIGWEEVAQSNLAATTVVQFWADTAFANMAAAKGARIIVSPANKAYLDMKYDSTTTIGLDWAARVEVDSAYLWTPASRLPHIRRSSILGVEAPLWTETVDNLHDVEYLVFPRLAGIAEIAWSPHGGTNWNEYRVRLGRHGERMAARHINFYRSKRVDWTF